MRARRSLARAGITGVHQHVGDGRQGWPDGAPYDGILVTAAAPEIPEALIRQLAPGGRLVMPLGGVFDSQLLVVLSRDSEGALHRSEHAAVRFVPLVAPEITNA